MGWELHLRFPHPKWSSSPFSNPNGIWSSPHESCRILLAHPGIPLASPSQVVLPPVVSRLAPHLGLSSTSTLDIFRLHTLWAVLKKPHCHSEDEISPLYAPEHHHPWSCHHRLRPWLEPLCSINSRIMLLLIMVFSSHMSYNPSRTCTVH